MVVNVASACGFTPQYAELQSLHNEFRGRGFQVVAFPSNEFGAQEPGTDAEIAEFCSLNFGVQFTVLPKSEVLGTNANTVFKWLAEQGVAPGWNFTKYLIDTDGLLAFALPAAESPMCEAVLNFLSE